MTIENIREKFPITRHYNFLNHAAISPLSQPAVDALHAYAAEQAEYAYLRGTSFDGVEKVRQSAAKLINADPSEVTFVKMSPKNGEYEPLIGYIVLEQSQAAVDMLGHRLIEVKSLDLK